VVNGEGKNIRSVQTVKHGEELCIHVTDGDITAVVKDVKEYEIRR
jgi:exonuclease VII large subunit